jgi:hypothetical protein
LHQLQSLDASNFAKNIKIPPITCYDQAMQQEVKFWINYVKLQLEQQSIYFLFIKLFRFVIKENSSKRYARSEKWR